MRCILLLAFLVSCHGAANLGADQDQNKAAPPGVAGLIEKMGSPKFVEREQAMKELEKIGAPALPLLRPALKSDDAEIRRRTEILVRKFEDQELTTKLLAGKRMRLNVKDATIAEAAAELSNQSYSVKLPPELENRRDIKITLDTGDTTFWEALQALSLQIHGAAPEVEQQPLKQPLQPMPLFMPGMQFQGSTLIPIGKLAMSPVSFAGSVRVVLAKVAPLPNGEIELTLEVTNEPGLLDFANASSVRLDKAIDDQGQVLLAQLAPEPQPANAVGGAIGIGKVGVAKPAGFVINRGVTSTTVFPAPATGFQSFQMPLRLKGGPQQPKMLSEVTGKIAVRTTYEVEPNIVIDKVFNAAGQSVKTKEGKVLRLLEIVKAKNGEIAVKVVMESPAQNPGIVGGVVQIQGAAQVIPRNIKEAGNRWIFTGTLSPLKLIDAVGKEFTQEGVTATSGTFSAAGITQMETVVFSPKPGQGEAARLVLPGYRNFTFDVPFSFKNVDLP